MAEKVADLDRQGIAQAIEAVDNLLASPAQFTHAAPAVNTHSKSIRPDKAEAIAWSLPGAIWAITMNTRHHAQVAMCFRAVLDKGHGPITAGEFSEVSSFVDVKKLITEAKAAALTMDPFIPVDEANHGVVYAVVIGTLAIATGAILASGVVSL